MKRILALILISALFLTGCSLFGETGQTEKDDGKLNIIATVFPLFDFARTIAPDANVTLLLPPGMESHSYHPTSQDIIRISECDLFLYIGGESETWIEQILDSLDRDVSTRRLIDFVPLCQAEDHGQTETDGHDHDHDHDHDHAYDEHIWTSLKYSVVLCETIAGALYEIDPENKAVYQRNLDAYTEELRELDVRFTDLFQSAERKTLVFGDRFPLRYFVESYGISYLSAFPSCGAESEPSAATVAALIDTVKAERIGTIFYIEFSNHLIADSIAEQTGAKTALFHTCHNVTNEELQNGVSYLSLMEQNLNTLKEALK